MNAFVIGVSAMTLWASLSAAAFAATPSALELHPSTAVPGAVAETQRASCEPHGAGEPAPQLGVGHGLAERLDGRLVPPEVEVPPGLHRVGLLDLRRRREDHIGVPGRIGEELLARMS